MEEKEKNHFSKVQALFYQVCESFRVSGLIKENNNFYDSENHKISLKRFLEVLEQLFKALLSNQKDREEKDQAFIREMALLERVIEKCYIFSTDIEYAQFYNKEIALRLGCILREFQMDWDIQINESQLIQINADKIFREIETKKSDYLKQNHKEFSDYTKRQESKEKQLEDYLKEINRLTVLMEKNCQKNSQLEMKIENQKQQKKILKGQIEQAKEQSKNDRIILIKLKEKIESEKQKLFQNCESLQNQLNEKNEKIKKFENQLLEKNKIIQQIKEYQNQLQQDLKLSFEKLKKIQFQSKQGQKIKEEDFLIDKLSKVQQQQQSMQNSLFQIQEQFQLNENSKSSTQENFKSQLIKNQIKDKNLIIQQLQQELNYFREKNEKQKNQGMIYQLIHSNSDQNQIESHLKQLQQEVSLIKQNNSKNNNQEFIEKISNKLKEIINLKNIQLQSTSKAQINSLEKLNQDYQNKFLKDQKSIQILKLENQQLSKKNKKLNSENEEFKKLIYKLEKKIKFKNVQIQQFNQLLSQFKEEKQFLLSKLKRLEERFFDEFIEKSFKKKNHLKQQKKLKIQNKKRNQTFDKILLQDQTMKKVSFLRLKKKRVNTMSYRRCSFNSQIFNQTCGSFKILPDDKNYIN